MPSGYRVTLMPANGEATVITLGADARSIELVKPEAQYTVSIAAINGAGESSAQQGNAIYLC